MFLAQLDPEYWSFIPLPREMRPEYAATLAPLAISFSVFLIAVIVSAVISATVISRLYRTRTKLENAYFAKYNEWVERASKKRLTGKLYAQPTDQSIPYGRKINRINAWLNTVVAIAALATIIAFANIFMHGKMFEEEVNSEGETRSESLQSWLSETYSIEVNESTAEQISSGRDRAVRYDGETEVVKLAWVGAEKYMLVRYDSLSPVETER